MPGKAKESNTLICSMWPDVADAGSPHGSHEWTGTVVDLPDKSANRQRLAATTDITLSDEGSRRERAEPPFCIDKGQNRTTAGTAHSRTFWHLAGRLDHDRQLSRTS